MEGRELDLPEDPVPADYAYGDTVSVLFGHYWMGGEPRILHPGASCLDFSVANGGFLTAYRWSGEPELCAENLVWVPSAGPYVNVGEEPGGGVGVVASHARTRT